MALLLGLSFGGELDPKVEAEFDNVLAALQTWVGKQEGLNEQFKSTQAGLEGRLSPVPVGSLFAWPTDTAPDGYLLCDGQNVSRTTYAALFSVLGVTYGSGSDATFAVPDLRGRFVLGVAASGTGSTLAGTGGAIDHTHSGGSVSGSTANESSHTHAESSNLTSINNNSQEVQSGTGVTVAADGHQHNYVGTGTGPGSAHGHGAGSLAVGTSGSANPPFLALNYIIKT